MKSTSKTKPTAKPIVLPDEEILQDDLAYDAEKDSFELDVKAEDSDYIHPNPYETAAENGADSSSSYDEQNPTATEEYVKKASTEDKFPDLNMHIEDGKVVELDRLDEELAKTPEDFRDDLDAEGYPKNDRIGKSL